MGIALVRKAGNGMAYITNQDIAARLGAAVYVQLTDDSGTGSADEAVATVAREAAEGEVNSHLARRHRVPIDIASNAELAAILASATLDLAEYRLHSRRPPVPESVTLRHRQAIEWLKRVATGSVVLPSAKALPGNDVLGPAGQAIGNESFLSREELEGL